METKHLLSFHTSTHLGHVRTGIDQSINLTNPHCIGTSTTSSPNTLRSIQMAAIVFPSFLTHPRPHVSYFRGNHPLMFRLWIAIPLLTRSGRMTMIWKLTKTFICRRKYFTCIWLHICGTLAQSQPRQTWPAQLSCSISSSSWYTEHTGYWMCIFWIRKHPAWC